MIMRLFALILIVLFIVASIGCEGEKKESPITGINIFKDVKILEGQSNGVSFVLALTMRGSFMHYKISLTKPGGLTPDRNNLPSIYIGDDVSLYRSTLSKKSNIDHESDTIVFRGKVKLDHQQFKRIKRITFLWPE